MDSLFRRIRQVPPNGLSGTLADGGNETEHNKALGAAARLGKTLPRSVLTTLMLGEPPLANDTGP